MNTKYKYIFFVILASAVCILFNNYLFGSNLFVFIDIGSDTIQNFYPKLLENLYLQSYGWMDTWSFTRGIGKNIFDVSVLDPTTWPFNFLGKQGISEYIVWRQVIRILLSGFFIFKYFELKDFSSKTSAVATIFFVFSGYMMVSSGWYAHTYFILNFSFAMYTLELFIRKGIWWPFAVAIALFFNFNLVFFAEFIILFSPIIIAENYPLFKNKKELKRIGLQAGKTVLLTLLLIAPFAGNMVYRFIYSSRLTGPDSKINQLSSTGVFDFTGANHYLTLIFRIFSPNMTGTPLSFKGWGNYLEAPVFYIGILGILLVLLGLKSMRASVRRAFGFILTIWIIIVIFRYFRYAFYGFGGSYYKLGLNLFIPFTLINAAAYGLENIFKESRKEPLVIIAAMILTGLLLGINTLYPGYADLQLIYIACILIWTYTIVIQFISNLQIRFFVIFILAISEGMYISWDTINDRNAIPKSSVNDNLSESFSLSSAAKQLHETDNTFYRVEKPHNSFLFAWNAAAGFGYYSSASYESHNHSNYLKFIRKYKANSDILNLKSSNYIDGILKFPLLHPFFSVKYYFEINNISPNLDPLKTKFVQNVNSVTILKNENFIPFGIPLEKYFTSEELNKIIHDDKLHMSLYEGVVIEDKDLEVVAGMAEASLHDIKATEKLDSISNTLHRKAFKMNVFYNDYIKGNIEVPKKCALVFTMPYDVGWKFYDNGIKVKPVLVNHGLTAIILEKGKHQIEMRYIPPFFYQGWVLFFAGFLWIIWLLWKSPGYKNLIFLS